jgi:hypothetical protein
MSDAGAVRSRLVFTNEDHAYRYRWAISVAFALLLHGAIAVAVLNRHDLISPARLGDPFIVDLLPLPDARAAPADSQLAFALDNGEILPSASGLVITNAPNVAAARIGARSQGAEQENGTESTAVGGGGASYTAPNNGHGGGQPKTGALITSPPATSAPAISHPAAGVPTISAPTAGTPTAAHPITSNPATSMENSPIDASMAPSSHSTKAAATGVAQSKAIVLLRPSKRASQFQHARNSIVAHGPATTTNAVGAQVQDRVRAALAKGTISTAARSSIGSGVTAPGMVGSGASASDGVTKNAIGAIVPIHPGMTNIGEPKIEPIKNPNAPIASAGLTTNRLALDGRTMVHPGMGAAALGGPTQIRQTNLNSGVLSGNMFHPRHQ